MVCKKCGKKLHASSTVCSECGTAVSNKGSASKKLDAKTRNIIIVAVVSAVIIAAAAVLLITLGSDKRNIVGEWEKQTEGVFTLAKYTYTFNEDGTGFTAGTREMTWEIKDGYLYIHGTPELKFEYELDGDVLKVKNAEAANAEWSEFHRVTD